MIPPTFLEALRLADISWHPILMRALEALDDSDPSYLPSLAASDYLPTEGRLFAAFRQPLPHIRYVLVGEGPYPRVQSATGVCFMDGAVGALWSEKGLSKEVNRATSLRNFIKMLLVAEGSVSLEACSGDALAEASARARSPGSGYCQTLAEIEASLHAHGFLLLNASLVFRPDVPPLKEGRAWKPFFQVVLNALAERPGLDAPTLVLWGKVAEVVNSLSVAERFPKLVAEHPYNLSFIGNRSVQEFFARLQLLHCREEASSPVRGLPS